MANMPDIKKRKVSTAIEVHTCVAVEKKYSLPGDTSKSVAYIRALEDATRDVVLTAEDHRAIAAEIEANELKRRGNKKEAK